MDTFFKFMAGHRLKDGIICDSFEGKCRVWTAGTELRSAVVSKMLYMRVTESQREIDCRDFLDRCEAKKPSRV